MRDWHRGACVCVIILSLAGACAGQGGGRPTTPEPARPEPNGPRRPRPRTEPRGPVVEPPARSVPAATLNIKSFPPRCTVLLNDKPVGTTDEEGRLRLRQLKPGTYSLTARRPDYNDEQRTVQLDAGAETAIEISLRAIPGLLNVTPGVPGARIHISNVGDYPDEIANLSLAPGVYQIEVTKPGYVPGARTLEMPPARTINLSVPLELLPAEQALAQAEAAMNARDYDTAGAICAALLTAQPDNMRAITLLGASHYAAGRVEQGARFLSQALLAGQVINLPVKRWRKGPRGDELDAGQLVLRRGSLGFQRSGQSGPEFAVPAAKIYDLRPERDKGGRIYLQLGLTPPGGGKEKKEKLYLHPAGASLSGKNGISCLNCQAELQAIFFLIEAARRH